MTQHTSIHPIAESLRIRTATRLEGQRGMRLNCLGGSAWITIDGEQRDVILEPGQSFEFDSDRPVLVQALRAGGPLDLKLTMAKAPRRPPSPGWMQRLRGFGLLPAGAA